MIRFTMLFLCILVAAAAFGRYRAEVSVREVKAEASSLDRQARQLEADIMVLRAEIAYLESPERLKKIADATTNLEPLAGHQLVSASSFLSVVTPTAALKMPAKEVLEADMDLAVALVDLGTVE